jgi:hypothetical protein
MSQFIYNEHGACLNPILKTFKCIKGYEAQVETAIIKQIPLVDNLWCYGIRFNGFEEGWSHTFNQHRPDNDLYKTKDEAFKGGIELLINQLKGRNEEQRYNRIIQILQDELCPVVENQLSLF